MAHSEGSYSGSVQSQSVAVVPDQPGHEVGLTVIFGFQRSIDAHWEGAKMTYWGLSDTVAGSGRQHGYFLNEHRTGEQTYGTFDAKISATGAEVVVEGQWRFSGGTGTYATISGSGPFTARLTSPTDVEMNWVADYEL